LYQHGLWFSSMKSKHHKHAHNQGFQSLTPTHNHIHTITLPIILLKTIRIYLFVHQTKSFINTSHSSHKSPPTLSSSPIHAYFKCQSSSPLSLPFPSIPMNFHYSLWNSWRQFLMKNYLYTFFSFLSKNTLNKLLNNKI
jgi:hypothetical protein